MFEIKDLEHTDFDTLFSGFERAFSDYDIRFEKEEVRSMLKRRGYDARLSFAAFHNGEIVAFTLNGIGMYNGVLTAYDTGTGTVKEYRGQRLAGKIFNHSIPYLKNSGVLQYLLEVLSENHKAISVYRRLNFKTTREFYCYRQTIGNIANDKIADAGCIIEPVGIDYVDQAQSFCDFVPSWQNSIESIKRGKSGLTCLGALMDGMRIGYCVFDSKTGDMTQIAVKKEYRRKGVGSRLMQEAVKHMSTGFIKVLNICSDNATLPKFLESKNIPLASKQLEMLLKL